MTQIMYEGQADKLWKINEIQIVTATHPDRPNFSGHARGRKCHLADDKGKFKHKETTRKKFTRCGMLVDDRIRRGDIHTVFSGRWCGQCFTPFEKHLANQMADEQWKNENLERVNT